MVYTLTTRDASVIKGMLRRGDKQQDIAAYYGVNGGRISDIKNGKTFQHVHTEASALPPSGPYDIRALVEENQLLRLGG